MKPFGQHELAQVLAPFEETLTLLMCHFDLERSNLKIKKRRREKNANSAESSS